MMLRARTPNAVSNTVFYGLGVPTFAGKTALSSFEAVRTASFSIMSGVSAWRFAQKFQHSRRSA